jgi:hypothetical protein
LIARIQKLEKEKLVIVAAEHLDKMNAKLSSSANNHGVIAVAPKMHESMTLSTTEESRKYNKDRITEIETGISELLDEFQALKCEHMAL